MGEPAAFIATYGIRSDSAARARSALADFATRQGVVPDTVDAVKLAVSEAVTNAIVHAYGGGGHSGKVRVAAGVRDGHIWISVEDDGCGHVTPSTRPGLGYGLRVIQQVVEHANITERPDGGTTVLMQFRRARNPESARLPRPGG